MSDFAKSILDGLLVLAVCAVIPTIERLLSWTH